MKYTFGVLMLVAGCWAQNGTLTPGAVGHGVVEASVEKIRFTCIFPDDKQFVRRMAYVETQDGQVADTYPEDYHGGIWKIDEAMYEQTKNPINPETNAHITAISNAFGLYYIDWHQTTWEDLRKPLYSAIAAYLYMYDQVGRDHYIPLDIDTQAEFWVDYIRPNGIEQDFIDAANTLQENCETATGADIVFVLDGSGSIGSTNFELVRDFVQAVVEEFEVSPTNYRFGVQQFSDANEIEFLLCDYDTKDDVLDAVENIVYMSGGTNTAEALNELVDISYHEDTCPRDVSGTFQRIAFVMTDGVSADAYATIEAAQRVHEAFITTFAISVGTNIRETELFAIASDPDCIHKYSLDNFDEFVAIIESIKKSTCDAPVIFADNETTDGEFLPGEGVNCQVFLPDDGSTCKLSPDKGPVNFYVATDTYPSPSYYEDVVIGYPEETGVMFLEGGLAEVIYCHILNNGSLPDNVTIGCFPGNQDNCENVTCFNGGSCNDLFSEGFECSCVDGFEGEFCEIVITTTSQTSTDGTTPGATTQATTLDPDRCEYCHDGPCDCQGIYAPNPCPPCAGDDSGTCFPGNLRPHYVFADGTNEDRFCQCDTAGGCFEFDCEPGLVYLECINSCAFPGTLCP